MSKNLNSGNFSKTVMLDADNTLTNETKQKIRTTLYEFDYVFSPDSTGYNGAEGPLKATVSIGPVLRAKDEYHNTLKTSLSSFKVNLTNWKNKVCLLDLKVLMLPSIILTHHSVLKSHMAVSDW
jgi:hypothetical protein